MKENKGLLAKDKKNVSTKLNLVLTCGFGDMFLQQVEADEDFAACVAECFDHYRRVVPIN